MIEGIIDKALKRKDHHMKTRDLLNEEDATLVLSHGFEVMDATTFVENAPANLVRRVAQNAGKIDNFTIWEQGSDEDAWVLTMPTTVELMSSWRSNWLSIMQPHIRT